MSELEELAAQIRPSTETAGSRTRYVMVPVPEELEDEFSGLILQMVLGAKLMRWDEHVARRLRASLDDPSWALVELLVRAEGPVGVDDVVQDLGTSRQDVDDLRNRVTAACTALARFDLIVDVKDEDENPQWKVRPAAIHPLLVALDDPPSTTDG